jgi:hypothetical protein
LLHLQQEEGLKMERRQSARLKGKQVRHFILVSKSSSNCLENLLLVLCMANVGCLCNNNDNPSHRVPLAKGKWRAPA